MASRITNGEENRLILGLCLTNCLRTPRIPIDRVVSMLLKVRAGFVDQPIGLALGLGRWSFSFFCHFLLSFEMLSNPLGKQGVSAIVLPTPGRIMNIQFYFDGPPTYN